MPKIVKLGDSSDHGGIMIQANGGFKVDDVNGCVDGDIHQCPIQGHGNTPVSSSSPHKADGKAILRSGDKAGCGATIIGSGSAEAT
jgi:uncharacterized Zn-binding protein involved in type VI secretion